VAAFLFGLSRYPALVSAAEPMSEHTLSSMPAE